MTADPASPPPAVLKQVRAAAIVVVGRTAFWIALVQTTLIFSLIILLAEGQILIALENQIHLLVKKWVNAGRLVADPAPKIAVWYLVAMIGNLITTGCVLIQMLRTRHPGRWSVFSGTVLGAMIAVVSLLAFPMLYLGWEAAYVNLVLAAFYVLFDVLGYILADDLKELREFSTYLWFLDLPTVIGSAVIVILFQKAEFGGASEFSIGAAGAMFILLAIISAISSLYLAFRDAGFGTAVRTLCRAKPLRGLPDCDPSLKDGGSSL